MSRPVDIHLLWKSGFLNFIDECGLNNLKTVQEYCRVYDCYLQFRGQGKNYTVSVEMTAEKLSVTERKVRRAVAFCV
jgi:hypothetical protein